jgi:hypothetical protein
MGRFVKDDEKMFKTFKDIFKGGEKNFIIIITHSNQKWIEENSETIKKNFGNYPVIPVDFPWSEDDDYAQIHQKRRKQYLQSLMNEMFNRNYKGIKLEVLSSSQKVEKNVAKVVNIVPVVGTAYQLTSAGVYHKLGKPDMAKKRLKTAALGLVLDVATGGTLGIATGVLDSASSAVAEVVAANSVQRFFGQIFEAAKRILK